MCLVLGAWCLVPGAWCLVLGAPCWCFVLGASCLVRALRARYWRESNAPSTKHQAPSTTLLASMPPSTPRPSSARIGTGRRAHARRSCRRCPASAEERPGTRGWRLLVLGAWCLVLGSMVSRHLGGALGQRASRPLHLRSIDGPRNGQDARCPSGRLAPCDCHLCANFFFALSTKHQALGTKH